jgi:hypothetical protein
MLNERLKLGVDDPLRKPLGALAPLGGLAPMNCLVPDDWRGGRANPPRDDGALPLGAVNCGDREGSGVRPRLLPKDRLADGPRLTVGARDPGEAVRP